MPIVDVELVCESENELKDLSAQELADALGSVMGTDPGRTWVRLRFLDARYYAENHAPVGKRERPAFVSIWRAHPPGAAALAEEAAAITRAIARIIGRSAERVHVRYAPAAAGRQAFGGKLVK